MKYLNVELDKSAKNKNIENLTIVDDEIFDKICTWDWKISKSGYVYYNLGHFQGEVYLHRLVMDFYGYEINKHEQVDHINGNRRDNQFSNLRICSVAENMRNRKTPKTNKSGYKGVHYNKSYEKYACTITHNNNIYQLGFYENAIDGAKIYDFASQYLHKEYAKNNGFNNSYLECLQLIIENNSRKIATRVIQTLDDIENGNLRSKKEIKKYFDDTDYLSFEDGKCIPIYKGTQIFPCKIKDNAIQLYNLILLHEKGKTYNEIKLYKTIEQILLEEIANIKEQKRIIKKLKESFSLKLNINYKKEKKYNIKSKAHKHYPYIILRKNKYEVKFNYKESCLTLGQFRDLEIAVKLYNLVYYFMYNKFYDTKVKESFEDLIPIKRKEALIKTLNNIK